MGISPAAFTFVVENPAGWSADLAWGFPLIVLTVLIHVLGLGMVRARALGFSDRRKQSHHSMIIFVLVMGTTTLLATLLHGIETGIWAVAYRILGALPDNRTAMLYSLNAITSYGHTNIDLAKHWQLMGALEALNGWLLFGLTTAFLFGVLEKVWLTDSRGQRR
jgi:MFS superfamily sulfate permease-like transporter